MEIRELGTRIGYYRSLLTEERTTRMEQVLENRTRYITVVLENIFQPHNASAVLRSCDAFGIQDVHIIENSNSFRPNPTVDMGTSQWLDLHRYRSGKENTEKALLALKKQGYRIAATTPHSDEVNLEEFNLTQGKTALLFGTELDGLTDTALELADEYVKIPMFGFVESFNISVSCALSLHHLVTALHAGSLDWHLKEREKQELLCRWLMRNTKRPELHEARIQALLIKS